MATGRVHLIGTRNARLFYQATHVSGNDLPAWRGLRPWPVAILAEGPGAFFVTTDLFIVASLIHDVLSQRRLHPANIWGGLFIVALQPLRLAIAGTATWLALARLIAS